MASSFALVDLVDTIKTAVAAPSGIATATFDQVSTGDVWEITYLAVSSNSTSNGPAAIYLDDATVPGNFRSGTQNGIGDSDPDASLIVPSGRSLVFIWEDMSTGASCVAVVQYKLLRRLTVASAQITGTVS